MAEMRVVKTVFWDDDYIGDLPPHGKLVFIQLFTNDKTNLSGCYQITIKKIFDDTGVSREEIREWIERFEKDGKVVYRDGWLLMRNFIKHQKPNTQIIKGIRNSLNGLPRWAIDILLIDYEWLSIDSDSLSPNLNLNLNSNFNSKEKVEDEEVSADTQPELSSEQIEFISSKPIRDEIVRRKGQKPKVEPITLSEWTCIREVFAFWRSTFGKNNGARLTAERGRAVLDRLRSVNKYSVEEIKTAILGCRASPYHNSSNGESGGKVYDDLELICRDDTKIERFIGFAEADEATNGNGNRPKFSDRRSAQAIDDFNTIENLRARNAERDRALSEQAGGHHQ